MEKQTRLAVVSSVSLMATIREDGGLIQDRTWAPYDEVK